MSTIFLKDAESSAVLEARQDRDRIERLGIRSPDVSKMFKLRINKQTMMFFKDAGHRSIFVSKYYNRKTKKFSFEKKGNIEDEYLLKD